MNEQMALRRLLNQKYQELRAGNPQYSRRAFSRKLGISAGTISEIFSGRRRVSRAVAERIVRRLGLDPQERSALLGRFPGGPSPEPAQAPGYLRLSADQFRAISEWHHFAILTLMRSSDFRSDEFWIARRLNLGIPAVRQALARLKRIGFVVESEESRGGEAGTLTLSQTHFRTSDDVADDSIRCAHGQYLDRARHALETSPVTERDFTSLMLTLDPKRFSRAKEVIRKFQDDFAAEFEPVPGPEVYQLCIQLFPLTRPSPPSAPPTSSVPLKGKET